MINPFKFLHEKFQQSIKDNEKRDLLNSFQVKEKNGKLWYTHNGYAFEEIETGISAKEVAQKLQKIRLAALKYNDLDTEKGGKP